MLDARRREAGRVGLDDEGAHPLATAGCGIGEGEDGQELRDRAVSDEPLAAVEDVVVTVAGGAHAVGRDVAAGSCLGQCERDQPFTGSQAWEVSVLLLLGAGKEDGQRAELLDDRDQAGRRVGACDLLDQDALRDRVERGAAVLLREARPEQVLLRQQVLEVPRELRGLVDRCGTRGDSLVGELAHHGTQLIVLGGRQVGHAAPRTRSGERSVSGTRV